MAIYNRWGDELKIVKQYGKMQVLDFPVLVTLVSVEYKEDSRKRFQFAEFLKADDGVKEIEAAVSSLEVSDIYGRDKALAIKSAL